MIAVLESCSDQPENCGSVQARVTRAAAGATVDLPDGCTYREEISVSKPLRLVGSYNSKEPVTILGSEKWSGWTRDGGRWVSKEFLPGHVSSSDEEIRDSTEGYLCKDGTERCKWPEQVFIDGQPLLQVASNPKSGQFAVDDSRRVILADSPAGHTVEVTVRQRWLFGRSGDVTVEGFVMSHAASDPQAGALDNNGNPNWTVANNDLSHAHGTVLKLGGASDLRIEGNGVHHGGQLGVSSAGGAGLEIVGNEIHHNNTEDFDPSWAAGGMKVANSASLLASSNEVYHNDQTGIWTDTGARNVILSDNRVHHNIKQGIRLEITDHAVVSGNVLYENGWGKGEGGDEGAGISVAASRDVEVYDNTLAWNAAGIAVVNTQRENGVGGSYPTFDTVSDVRVHHNTILSEDSPSGEHLALVWRKTYAGGDIYEPAANNRGYDNSYWSPSPEGTRQLRFVWGSNLGQLADFNATPGEERGRYLTGAEKDQVLTTEGIPAAPEREMDVTPPDAPQITDPAQDRYTNVHRFSVSGTAEPGSTVDLFEGGTSEKSGIATDAVGNWSTSLGFVPNGEYAYTAKATDGVNNTSAASDVRRVIVDSQKPDTKIDLGPATVDKTASATFSFSSNEANATFECALDGGAFGPCSSPEGYTGLGEGQHAFSVRAVDRAGNTDGTPAKRAWTVDTTGAPAVTGVAPAEDAAGVALAAEVSVYFSEPMRASTINANTVKLSKVGSSTARSATVAYDATAKKATLNPSADLQPGAEYKAVVSTGAKDIAGIQLDQDPSLSGNQSKVWFFTVRN